MVLKECSPRKGPQRMYAFSVARGKVDERP